MWSNQEANNTYRYERILSTALRLSAHGSYSIQTYHTYQRVADLNGTVRTFTSGVGWQMVDGWVART